MGRSLESYGRKPLDADVEKNGAQEIKAIKKATKLKNEELYMALGWLAREGKLAFSVNEKEITIELV